MKSQSIEQVVQNLVKSSRKKLTPVEVDSLTRSFLEAGTQAVRAQIGSTREAAQALDFARKLSELARLQLARKTTRPLKEPLQSPDWERLARVMSAHQAELTQQPGVVGIGLGYRIKAGIRETEKTITVFVERKLLGEDLEDRLILPVTLQGVNGDVVPVDVVAFGKFRRNTSGGSSIGQGGDQGTLGVFAKDLTTSKMVALTAQHVVGARARPGLKLFAPWPQSPASVLVGHFLRGTTHDTDAAVIEVADPDTILDIIPDIGRVNGWRPVVDSDRNRPVWMYGAESGYQLGEITTLHCDMPELDLTDTLVVRIHAQRGDSGAAILDHKNLVLGLLVGGSEDSDLNVFTPIGLVLERLDCHIPTR